MTTSRFRCSWLGLILMVLLSNPLSAAIVQTGDVVPGISIGASIYIGRTSTGSVTVDAGSLLASQSGFLGYSTGSTGTVAVTGPGSKWINSGDHPDAGMLQVGDSGAGTLLIEAGGQVSNTRGWIGYGSGSTGTATVTGAGSRWTNSSHLMVGGLFGAGTLTVSDGGEVVAGTLYAALSDLHGNGSITATAGAVLDADLTFDATHGNSQSVAFGSGGILNVTVNGGALGAGYKQVGSLTISEGVEITSTSGYLGYQSGSAGKATVTGPWSKWTNSSNLEVGNNGSGELTIEAGGLVSNARGYIGGEFRSIGTGPGSVIVSGRGSEWVNSRELYVGYRGVGALAIEAGGVVSNTNTGYLGHYAGASGTATVTGEGSKWTNSSNLMVGLEGNGALTVEVGGLVSVRGTLTTRGDSFVNMSTGGMLALYGDADDSVNQFLGRVQGTDAIRFWDDFISDWAPITTATFGIDYTLEFLTAGELAGYTLLTVGEAIGPNIAGDFNGDGFVNTADYTVWRDGLGTVYSQGDYDLWADNYGTTANPGAETVPEPTAVVVALFALTGCGWRRGVR